MGVYILMSGHASSREVVALVASDGMVLDCDEHLGQNWLAN